MADDEQELDPSESVAGQIANCPTAIKKLSEALWPTLLDNLEGMAAQARSRRTGGLNTVVSGQGQSSSLASISEAYDDDNQQKEYTATGNEAFHNRDRGNKEYTAMGNGAYTPTGNGAYQGGSYGMMGNEALQTKGYGYNPTGYEGHQGRAYAPSGNEASDSPSREEAGSEAYFGLVPGCRVRPNNCTGESGESVQGRNPTQPLAQAQYYGGGAWPCPPAGYWPIQGWSQPPPMWSNPWGPYQVPAQPQMPGSPQLGRKRPRPEDAPSTSSATDISEEDIDPFVSGSERRDLLGSSSEDESDEEETPAAKRSFVPSEDILKFLKSISAKPLKNDKRKLTVNKFPTPSADPVHPPKLDEAVTSLVPKSAKTQDNFLSRLQRFTLDAAAPLVWGLHERSQGKEVDMEGVVKCSLALLGNASAHFNVERRKSVLKHLNKDLEPLAEAEFPDRGAYLFGDNFGKRAKQMSDNVTALKGTKKTSSFNRFSGGGDPNRRFSKPQGRRTNWGITYPSRKSVFGRLDHPPRPKFQKPSKPHQRDQTK